MSNDFENIFHLETHESSAKAEDRLALAVSASLLLFYLRKNGYFGDFRSKDSSLSEHEKLIGGLLYHILQVTQFNTHQVQQIESWEEGSLGGVQVKT